MTHAGPGPGARRPRSTPETIVNTLGGRHAEVEGPQDRKRCTQTQQRSTSCDSVWHYLGAWVSNPNHERSAGETSESALARFDGPACFRSSAAISGPRDFAGSFKSQY